MSWLLVASSHDIVKIPRTCHFVEILVEIDRQAMPTCDGTKLKLSIKIRKINGERIPTGQQQHRVKIITTKPEYLDGEVLQEYIGTFEEILQLTNIFSIQVNSQKNVLYIAFYIFS